MFRLSERDLLSAVIERTLDRATPNNNGVGGRRKSDEESSYRSQAKPNRKPVYTHFNVCASGNGWNRGRAIGSISRICPSRSPPTESRSASFANLLIAQTHRLLGHAKLAIQAMTSPLAYWGVPSSGNSRNLLASTCEFYHLDLMLFFGLHRGKPGEKGKKLVNISRWRG